MDEKQFKYLMKGVAVGFNVLSKWLAVEYLGELYT